LANTKVSWEPDQSPQGGPTAPKALGGFSVPGPKKRKKVVQPNLKKGEKKPRKTGKKKNV